MQDKVFLGIDTSNYTTSISFSNMEGEIIKNYKILLPVKEGERGLRQSDAVFAHIKNIPQIAKLIESELKEYNYEIMAVGHSAYPRDCEGSYMPCFLVGEAISELISSLYKIKNFKFSHQSGHIKSALYSAGISKIYEPFIAFHVSGGTTEILYVTPNSKKGCDITLIGGSKDLHAGQAIDRIGVKMGLKFPCGPQFEALATKNDKEIPVRKLSVDNLWCNLSGIENLALKLYETTNDKPLVCAFTLNYIGNTLIELTNNLRKQYKNIKIVFAGGVMSNSIIKKQINTSFKDVYFALPEFSSDNAAGIALLTRENFLKEVL